MLLRSLIPTGSRNPLTRGSEDPLIQFQRAMLRGFEDGWPFSAPPALSGEASMMAVKLDVKEDDKAYRVTADLPGLTEKDVDVTYDDGVLTIRGEKKAERDEKKETWHIVERSYGSFARQIALPPGVDEDKIEAKFEKGVLTITLPKMPEDQNPARKIAVKAG